MIPCDSDTAYLVNIVMTNMGKPTPTSDTPGQGAWCIYHKLHHFSSTGWVTKHSYRSDYRMEIRADAAERSA